MGKWLYISIFSLQLMVGKTFAQTAVKPKPLSQNVRAFKLQAEKEFRASHFETAITLYKTYFKRIDFTDKTAVFNVAESYRLSKQYDSALVYFKKLSVLHPRFLNNLAELYATLGDYSSSIETYKSIVPADSVQLKKIETRILGFKGREDFQLDSLDWKLTSSKINSDGNESNPVRFKNGIVFTSAPITRKNGAIDQAQPVLLFAPDSIAQLPAVATTDSTKGKNKTKVKQPKKSITIDITSRNSVDNNTLRKPVSKPKPIVQEETNSIDPFLQKIISGGPIQFSSTGDTVYYTQSVKLKDKKSKLGIFYAVKLNNQWKEKDEITSGYSLSTFHPAVSNDGKKIFFVVDDKDGFGGPDLYFVERLGDTAWSSPTNAGPHVNTAGNELYPTIIGDSLYFSTNGRGGLGGQDIFAVDLKRTELPVNLGFPINSSYDDYGFVFNESRTGGYVSSNRSGSGDIYAFNFKKVYYRTGGTINYASDNTIAKSEQVYLIDAKTDQAIDSSLTDDLGNYYFNLRPNRIYRIEQREFGIPKGSYVVNTKEPVYVDSSLLTKRITVDSVAIAMNEKSVESIRTEIVAIDKSLDSIKSAIVALQKDTVVSAQTIVPVEHVLQEPTLAKKQLIQSQLRELTSDLARLNYKKLELSIALAPTKDIVSINSARPVDKIQINIKLPGVSPKQRADSIAYVLQQRVIKQREEEELMLRGDQLTRFNVYFGFSKFNLNLMEQKILDSTIKVLKANPNLFAVMGSFTDCSGPIDFNLNLSAKRSAAVLKYLIQHGIEKNRIRENHYGKNYLVQNCSPKRYSSRQQLLNRRTEIYLTNDKSLAWTDLAADTTKKYTVYTALAKKLSDFVSLKTVYVSAKKLKVDSSQLTVDSSQLTVKRAPVFVKKDTLAIAKVQPKPVAQQPITKNLQPTTVKQDTVAIAKVGIKREGVREKGGGEQPVEQLTTQNSKPKTVKSDSVVIVRSEHKQIIEQLKTQNSKLTTVKQDSVVIVKVETKGEGRREKGVGEQPVEQLKTQKPKPATVKSDSVVILRSEPKQILDQLTTQNSKPKTVQQDTVAIAKVEIKREGEREKGEGKQPVDQLKTQNSKPATVKSDSVVIVRSVPKQIIEQPKTQNAKPKTVQQDTVAIAKAQPPTVNRQPPTVNTQKQLTAEEEDRITREELLSALDSLAKLRREQERIVDYLTKRINKKPIEVFTYADSVTVEIFDSGIHDKDSVSVIFNRALVVDKHELKVDKPIKFKLRVDKDRRNNEMVIVAENLGTYPPNTAVMIITDKFGKHEEIMLSTDLSTNEVVIFIRIDKQANSNPTKNQP